MATRRLDGRSIESLERAALAAEAAGDIERLEELHARIAEVERDERARKAANASIAMNLAIGERRAALRELEAAAAAGDEDARARAVELAGKRARGAFVRITLGEGAVKPVRLALGAEIVIGRSEGLRVASNALGRRHVAIARQAGTGTGTGGAIVLRDLGSRNGTTLRGVRVAGEIAIGEGVDVMLGGEVPMRVTPSDVIAGAAAIEVGGATWVAPLGAGKLGLGAWAIETIASDDDAWLELVTMDAPPAFDRDVQLVSRVQLLAGDAFSRERNGPIALRVHGTEAP